MQFLHSFLVIILILSSLFVFLSDNPVHSVLFLIFAMCNAATILFLFNAEFLGLIFIIIYVGAIAILFLFVVMMLNVKISQSNLLFYFPFIVLSGVILFFSIFLSLEKSFSNYDLSDIHFTTFDNYIFDNLSNIDVIGQSLYNYFISTFLVAGLILLVAMIGAICLTLNFTSSRKNELASRQLSRSDTFSAYFK